MFAARHFHARLDRARPAARAHRGEMLAPDRFSHWTGRHPSSVHAMKAGAVDFLTKPIDNVRLFGALDQALRFDDAERRTRAIRTMIERRVEALTPREREVMQHVVCGRLNKQIAADLGTGEKTVKVHRGA